MIQNQISIGTILKASGFIIAAAVCAYNIKRANQQQKLISELKKAQLKNIDDIGKMKKGDELFAKLKLQKNSFNTKVNIRVIKKPISYNQYYLEQPSDLVVIQDLYREQQKMPIFQKNVWDFMDQNERKISMRIQNIQGDVYNIHKRYDPFENGLLKQIWGGFCYCFEWMFDFIRKRSYQDQATTYVPIYRKPLIQGPTVGLLQYTVSVLTDVYFVVKVCFDGNLPQAVIVAESKNALLGHHEFQLSTAKVGIFIFGVITGVLGFSLYKQVKKWTLFRGIMTEIQKKRGRKLLESEQVGQDKLCIICYTNCRNFIFFDCKHLIMCRDCWKTMNEDHCPICKNVITAGKIIYVDEKNKNKAVAGGGPLPMEVSDGD